MKKLLVLSVLLGLMALPMFASDITFGGDVTLGFSTDFSGDVVAGVAQGYDEEIDLTLDIKAAIDDYNSLAIELDGLDSAALGGVVNGLEKGLVTTDVGMWLGLPVGLKVAWGYDDPNWNDFAAISAYDLSSIDLSPDEYWGLDFLISYKFFEFELAWNPGVATAAGDVGYLLAGLAVKEPIKGLSAEVFYFQEKSALDAFDAGSINFDAVYAMEFGDFAVKVGPGFAFYLDDVASAFGAYRWVLAATATYGMFDFSTELAGYDGEAFAGMDAVLKIKPIEKVQLYGGLVLSFVGGGVDTFQGADVGAAVLMGAATAYVGYVITENGAGEINGYFSPVADQGGFYVAFDVNY